MGVMAFERAHRHVQTGAAAAPLPKILLYAAAVRLTLTGREQTQTKSTQS